MHTASLQVADLVPRVINCEHDIRKRLFSKVLEEKFVSSVKTVVTYGKAPIDLSKIGEYLWSANTAEEVEHSARWVIKSYEHAQHIGTNPQLFLPVINNVEASVRIKYAGIESVWYEPDIANLYGVFPERVKDTLSPIAENSHKDTSDLWLTFIDKRLSNEFIGDANVSTLQRAWVAAKRKLLIDAFNDISSFRVRETDAALQVYIKVLAASHTVPYVTINDFHRALSLLDVYATNPALDDIRKMRNVVLNQQTLQQRRDENVRKQLTDQKFSNYWDTMKSRIASVAPSVADAAKQFATVPLLPEGTETSRTWGIEVETVRAQLTSRPRGWESVHDGSLNNSDSSSCSCECDGCYDGDHCNRRRDDCYDDATGEGREFVSPVLNHFNSSGLQQLCNDLPDDEDDSSPGIHVHVGALDLSVTDVARLLASYSIIRPLLAPLYHRQTEEYCRETAASVIRWWLAAARSYLRENGTVPEPRHICESNPNASRYLDVNVHALSKHGTIEFRSMGPYYNYDHLVRWAWLVRELTNVSKLGLPLSTWTKCRSLLDVIKVLRNNGSEIPSDKEFVSLNTSEFALSYSEE